MNNIAIITMLSRLDQLQDAGYEIGINVFGEYVNIEVHSNSVDRIGFGDYGQLTKTLPGLVADVYQKVMGETQCSVECAGEAP